MTRPAPITWLLAGLLCLSVLAPALAQRTKKPLYQDDIILTDKNLIQVRVPVVFYAYALGSSVYENRKQRVPIFIGGRYERLLRPYTGVGVEVEMNHWDSIPQGRRAPLNRPGLIRVTKINPFVRVYMRPYSQRKKEFRGFFFSFGPSLMAITNSYDDNTGRYEEGFVVGLATNFGYQMTFDRITLSASLEGIGTPEFFKQEGWVSGRVGNGGVHLNVLRFYAGYKF